MAGTTNKTKVGGQSADGGDTMAVGKTNEGRLFVNANEAIYYPS